MVAVEQIQKSAETFLLPIYREAGPNSSVKQHSRPKPLTDANTSKATDMVEFFLLSGQVSRWARAKTRSSSTPDEEKMVERSK